ncbi:MAG: HypC/HybG/HupF family hydrogenase formation chaperone [Myxococcales bacterium]|nr:HypC/HybG/HupF family hydrogenase formation chaperone [Myxococcales bacterium]
MCLGLVMTVVESEEAGALVAWEGERRWVSTLLIGRQPVGAHLLVHVDTAVRVVEDDEAELLRDALSALADLQAGGGLDGHFADLEREPTLPPHLRGKEGAP